MNSRSVRLVEYLEFRLGDQSPGASHWVICFVPSGTLIDLIYNVEEVTLAKAEFVGGLGSVVVECADNFLGWLNGRSGFGHSCDWRGYVGKVVVPAVVYRSAEKIHRKRKK